MYPMFSIEPLIFWQQGPSQHFSSVHILQTWSLKRVYCWLQPRLFILQHWSCGLERLWQHPHIFLTQPFWAPEDKQSQDQHGSACGFSVACHTTSFSLSPAWGWYFRLQQRAAKRVAACMSRGRAACGGSTAPGAGKATFWVSGLCQAACPKSSCCPGGSKIPAELSGFPRWAPGL